MSTTMTVQLEEEMKQRLDRLAALTQRSESTLAAEAIRDFVTLQEWQLGEIDAALREADAGEFVSDEAMAAFAGKWRGHAA